MRILSDDEVVTGAASSFPARPPRAGASPVLLRVGEPLRVSVVVCCYTERRWAVMGACLRSLADQSVAPFEVVLVVDHAPGLAARARAAFPWVRVVASSGPPGLSGARNTGIEAAGGDVIAFLDDDATAAHDWLERLLDLYRDREVAGVGGRVVPRWAERRPDWLPPEMDWTVGCSYRGLPETVSPVRNFIGANMSFRRSVLDGVGSFSVELGRQSTRPLGCEETELCLRVVSTFGPDSLRYHPGAIVHHHVEQERVSWRYFAARCLAEGRSKAVMTRLNDQGTAALATERRYVSRVLPRGAAQAVADGICNPRRALAGPAIGIGLALTAAAYLRTRARPGPVPGAAAAGKLRGRLAQARPLDRRAALHVTALVAAAGLWAAALVQLKPAGMGAWGLVGVLPVTYWAGLAVLTASAAALFARRRCPASLAVGHLVTLVLALYATASVTYPELRYSWAWKHVGVTNYIMGHHSIGRGQGLFTAYHGWPGFFALNALLTAGSHLPSALAYASWGPPVFELLDLGPLFLIIDHFSDDRRLTWTALWFYLIGNWIGQDYFSPQAASMFLYLAGVAMALRWLPEIGGAGRVVMGRGNRVAFLPLLGVPRRRVVGAVLMLLAVAIISAHQLTPYMLVAVLAGLAAVRARRTGWLAAATAVAAVAWAATAGRYFLEQNANWVFHSIGTFLSNASPRASGFSTAPVPAQMVVDRLAEGLSGAVAVLAVIGALRRRRRTGRADRALLVVAVAPLPLLAANSYGGEMVLRCYLFSLPALAFLAASALRPPGRAGKGPWTGPLVGAVMVFLTAAFQFAYFGAEQTNYFTPAELAASNWIYDHAPAGSLVWGADDNLPWGYRETQRLDYQWLNYASAAQVSRLSAHPASVLASRFRRSPEPYQYVILTRSEASIEILGMLPAGAVARMERDLAGSPLFTTVYRNRDSVIFRYVGGRPV